MSQIIPVEELTKATLSVTFIPTTVFNNPILLRANPEYYAWLLSLPTLERERLLGGNWKIRPAAGLYFAQARPGVDVPRSFSIMTSSRMARHSHIVDG